MKLLSSLSVLSTLAAASFASHISERSNGGAKVLYFMSNIDSRNSVHALPVMKDGTVGRGTVTMTGGNGSRAPSDHGLTDALNSQGSIAILDNYLFIVNAGSNTLSMMKIDSKDPTKLTLVGKPIDTVGDWPNSVAVSKKHSLGRYSTNESYVMLQSIRSNELTVLKNSACVANSGTTSGIACFTITSSGLQYKDNIFRPLTLQPIQPTPPVGPFNTVSQVFFSNDMSTLFSTVKGDPLLNSPTFGYLASFPIKNGKVSAHGHHSSPNGTAVLFGSVALPGDHILATDASFGAALLKVQKNGMAETIKKVAIPGNVATCWAALSPATGLIYTTDDGNPQIGAFDPSSGQMVNLTHLDPSIPNLIEVTAVNDLLYALSHGNHTIPPHIIVMKTLGASGGVKLIQKLRPGGVGINVEGLAPFLE